ncbi:MAG: hypothetical protein OHK0029_31090 [Armatimonadaceae bacterium]
MYRRCFHRARHPALSPRFAWYAGENKKVSGIVSAKPAALPSGVIFALRRGRKTVAAGITRPTEKPPQEKNYNIFESATLSAQLA